MKEYCPNHIIQLIYNYKTRKYYKRQVKFALLEYLSADEKSVEEAEEYYESFANCVKRVFQ